MMQTQNQTGSKKKLLVPVVVLMLCLVSLAGVAYAYSSTLTNTANTVEAKDLTLDLSHGGAQASDIVTDVQIITITDNFGYAGVAAKTNDIKYTLITADIAVYKIKVTGEAPFDTFKVSSSDLLTLKPFKSVNSGNDTTMNDLFTFTYQIGVEADRDSIATGTLNSSTSVTMLKNTEYYVTVTATAKIAEETVLEHVADAYEDDPAAHVALDYVNAVKALSFSLTLEASKA